MVARREDRLADLAGRIAERTGRRVHVVAADLALPDAAASVHQRVAELGVDVDVLVNNAGFGTDADVVDTDGALLDRLLQLNVVAVTGLPRLFAADMVARGRGTIVNVASLAALTPVPHMAVYAASKAYVRSFTDALGAELWGTGVRAITALPGPTSTEFAEQGGLLPGPPSMHADPAQVVGAFLDALERPRTPGALEPPRGGQGGRRAHRRAAEERRRCAPAGRRRAGQHRRHRRVGRQPA